MYKNNKLRHRFKKLKIKKKKNRKEKKKEKKKKKRKTSQNCKSPMYRQRFMTTIKSVAERKKKAQKLNWIS